MKKSLIFSIIFAIISFVGATDVFAASIDSYSIDVTVGEVDKISTDEENIDTNAPETGFLGLDTDSAMPIVIATTIPIAIILAFAFIHIYHKHTK